MRKLDVPDEMVEDFVNGLLGGSPDGQISGIDIFNAATDYAYANCGFTLPDNGGTETYSDEQVNTISNLQVSFVTKLLALAIIKLNG